MTSGGTIRVLRTWGVRTSHRIWVAFDERDTLYGRRGETMGELLTRWRKSHDESITEIVRYRGVMRPSEAVMTMTNFRLDSQAMEREKLSGAPDIEGDK